MDLHSISLRLASRGIGGAVPATLEAEVLDSDANPFTVANRCVTSNVYPFTVDEDVKNSSGTDFTIFT